jgi:hypothetical protein
MVYSREKRVFILKHYFAPKSFAAVREELSNAYPAKEVPNNTIHRQFSFEESIIAEGYLKLLTQFISLLEENDRNCWFQHDGAMTDTANTTIVLL